MLPALLFDVDGTLMNSDPLHAEVFIDYLAEFGVTMTEAEYTAKLHGRQNQEIFADLLPDEDAKALDVEKEARFRARLHEIERMTPGAEALIARAQSIGTRMAVVTNACRENLDAFLAHFGLRNTFDFVISADEVSAGKPHPEIYLTAIAAIGATPEASVVFEDSPSGLKSAYAAGADVIGMTSSLDAEMLAQHGATFAIEDFNDPRLDTYLQRFQGARA